MHPLVRRSILDALPVTERNALHLAAGRLLRDEGEPVESAAAQLATLPPSGSSEVAETCLAAAGEAASRAAPAEAIRWLERALAEGSPEPPRGRLLAALGFAEFALDDQAAPAHLQEALDLTEDPVDRLEIAVALVEAHLLTGRWDLGVEVVRSSRSWAAAGGNRELEAIGVVARAYTPDMVEELDREREELAQQTGEQTWGSRALAAALAAIATHRGDQPRVARELIDRAGRDGGLFVERSDAAWAGSHLLIALVELEEYEDALAASHEMTRGARRDGSLRSELTSLAHRAWVHNRMGDLPSAEADLRITFELAVAGSPTAVASQAFYCQDALLERHGLEDVVEQVLATELPEGLGGTWLSAALLAARGRLRLARRDQEGAIADLRASNETHIALRMGPTVSPSRSGLALALPPAAREEAVALVDEELALARACGLPRPQGLALRAEGILVGGELGIERLKESVDLLDGTASRLELARSLVELGAALRRAGRSRDARAQLGGARVGHPVRRLALGGACTRGARRQRSAAAADRRHGAGGAHAERAAGGGPGRPGATNPQIAQELFVGLKTVETHLSNAYAKLGIAGAGARERLSDALAGEGAPA